ncbi:hypothetical protein E1B03_15885 [Citrobacter arsenatis]|uniref:Uncharacterized protein n=1 Tax=Citrobacter arsenatis TaxID=2546350 RepID=A0A4P6WPT4_9ENTR|nr:hypothetical protein E1B03_15885 [Citrobacter arsenatis]
MNLVIILAMAAKKPGRSWGGVWYGLKRMQHAIRSVLPWMASHSPHKKRPNTIPVFGPGKWLLGESRALKVGINAG